MINRGDVVSCTYWEKEGRPAVVLRVLPDGRLLIIAGTKEAPTPAEYVHEQPEPVSVLAKSRTASILGLSYDTWFKKQGVTVTSPAKVTRRGSGTCPTALLLDLEKLVG